LTFAEMAELLLQILDKAPPLEDESQPIVSIGDSGTVYLRWSFGDETLDAELAGNGRIYWTRMVGDSVEAWETAPRAAGPLGEDEQ
jgi:hypothetical protein